MAVNPQKWVDLHGDILFRFALARLRDQDAAAEAVQETFLAALQNLHRFRGLSAERTWLTGILKHKIIDQFRKSTRVKFNISLDGDSVVELDRFFHRIGHWKDQPRPWGRIPSEMAENKEFWTVFYRGIEELPERLRTVFLLREVDGMETREICKVLRIGTTNFSVMMHRARLGMRKFLQEEWFEKKDSPAKRKKR